MLSSQPLRSLLFVPADSEPKLAKALGTQADALIIDLEDAVAPVNKSRAREIAAAFLNRGRGGYKGAVLVRFHECASPEFERDCRLLREAVPDGIVMAKCSSADDVGRLADALQHYPCGVVPMIESAFALLQAASIATASPRVAALGFGAEDFSSDVGITRSDGEPELLYARSAVVTAARAAGIRAVDTPWLAYRDEAGLEAAAQRARNLGFSGKLAIHPAQLATLNRVFFPTREEIARAEEIIRWADLHGTGATGRDGQMIDEAVVRKARIILGAASGQGSSGAAQ
ncbi:MAG TPA: CoA ester lyase [Bryobacteraceae bacterium]|nr:CoA ester lyase [Bryobacteraceae bacterium]